ncbi:MAG: NADPH-dependent oxidoreductase [Candidatus Amulumruptor caecigallinarius]|uniref:Nitroreductase family protein n=1 Tax=Candidatus Amulumruptor caecigallinarius TaxID=2109911 RepID=A0A4Q0UBY2_9BACT|nr:MAG: NADPH-dependent oxidoreductase [Candidatus Amulumruptor caecigallinarius]HJE38618.1 nitroreductase family protein [Candidatus Amulumruptor caecigallinarius]
MDNRYFYDRRTHRAFSDREVTDKMLEDLLEAAAHAPTTGNMQLYSVIVTREAEARKALAATHFSQPASVNAPVLLTFCADFNRFTAWCRQSAAAPGYDNLQGFTTAMLDAVIFAQQFNTVAEMNGLGCCYLGTTTYNAPDIARLLELPQLVVPVVTLAVGYPAGEVEDCGRLPVKCLIHRERYHEATPEEIVVIYAEKEARDDSRRFVEENGKENLAQVFTDVRYTRQMMESFSAVWRGFIESQGFKL